jgi:DivIVA protein
VNGFGRRGDTIHRPQASGGTGSRFGNLSERLAGAFSNDAQTPLGPQWDDDPEHPGDLDGFPSQDLVLARFPIARQGYDCEAVDEHMYALEAALTETQRELAELRGHSPRAEIAAEIERLGEQTSAILITAHDKANETISLAQAQAQTCIADAASYAAALREEAKVEQRQAETETKSLRRERTRLINDMQKTATALSTLATDSVKR